MQQLATEMLILFVLLSCLILIIIFQFLYIILQKKRFQIQLLAHKVNFKNALDRKAVDSGLFSKDNRDIYNNTFSHSVEKNEVVAEKGLRYLSHAIKSELSRFQLTDHTLNEKHTKTNHGVYSISKLVSNIEYQLEIVYYKLNYGSITLSPSDFSAIYITDIIENALAQYPFRTTQEKAYIRIKSAADLEVIASKRHLLYIIFNLIENALETIGHNKGSIVISWCDSENEIQIHISNTPNTLHPQEIPLLFEAGYSQKIHRLGLGLTFCQHVMKKMNGELTCTITPSNYTVFTLHFPKSHKR